MQLSTKVHTVFILLGPTYCDKKLFASNLSGALAEQGRTMGMNYSITSISADAYRRHLMKDVFAEYNTVAASEVHEQTMKLVLAEFDAVTSFPVNHDFVILDTSELHSDFRDEVRRIALERGYNVELVVFDFPIKSVTAGVPDRVKDLYIKQHRVMRKYVMSDLKPRLYSNVTRLTDFDNHHASWKNMKVAVLDAETLLWTLHALDLDKTSGVAVIGDAHESVEALKALIDKLNTEHPGLQIIHAGDFIDKGGDTEGMLKYMLERVKTHNDIVVRGNHEHYAVRRLRGQITPAPAEIEDRYMSSIKVLQEREDLQEILFEIYDWYTVPFLKIFGENCRTMFVTHAPCDEVFLGKLSQQAIRAQCNLRAADPNADYRLSYEFLFQQASDTKPWHVFGHVAHKSEELVYKNKVFLDTGAVYGNKLTALVYSGNGISFVQVPSRALEGGKILRSVITRPLSEESVDSEAEVGSKKGLYRPLPPVTVRITRVKKLQNSFLGIPAHVLDEVTRKSLSRLSKVPCK